jgi:glucose/arabinose dehydrogenase
VHVTAPPGDERRLFVVEQGGRIRVIRGGRTLAEPFLDVSDRIVSGGEQGLLSMAFAPDYARSGRFYVYYTDRGGDTRVVEYERANADRADPRSDRLVLAQEQPESNHNGGQLAFGPDDLLYIGLGDGGGRATSTAGAETPRTSARCSARSCGSIRGRPGAAPTASRRRIRSSGALALAARSTPTGCATRGASPSTAARAT